MKSIKEKLEIDYLKSLTYTEINEKMNMLNDQINQLKNELQLMQTAVIESVFEHTDCGKDGITVSCKYCKQVKHRVKTVL
tara:strand:+ start:97 stop:336 length:240 start_codon:yes stop_codon:yes gene_type:complete